MRILFVLLLAVVAMQTKAQNTVADARKEIIGSVVTVTGIVTNGDEMGKIRYLQDTTAGIAVYDDQGTTAKRGDSITVTGQLVDYNNLLEISNVTYLKLSSSHELPAPEILSIDQIGEDYEGQLIQINNVELEGAGGLFSGGKNYDFTDGTNTGEFRINTGSPIVGKPIPSGKINLVAICSQYSRENNDTRNGYQLLPRDMDDFISGNSVNITSEVRVVEIGTETIKLSWNTDISASAFVRYGSTNDETGLINYKAGDSSPSADENVNEVIITGLQPSEILYAQVFNVNESDTAFSSINAYITESNSTGKINVFFNSPVDESKATESLAKDIGNAMEDTLAAYINQAEESIDFCIYNFDNSTISNALNAAYNRGVKIRVITCESTSHYSTNDLNAEIPVLERPEIQEGGIMHNKFAIFDGNNSDANKSWVWSGSTNLTQGQLYSDANNMIFVQDQSLAKTYEIEFEEMWGSTGDQPNKSHAKFGEEKTNNTPHDLLIGGNRVECYFSPSDNTNQKLMDAMKTADQNLSVQTMLITRSELANEIIDAFNRGVQVHVITDEENSNSETVNDILSNELPGGKYIFDDNASGILHHKIAIIDANDTISDPQVITGSHNWSLSANTKNDENTLIIHNSDITNQYFQQFAYRFEQNNGNLLVSANNIQILDLKVFPNPTKNHLMISSKEQLLKIEVYSIYGKLIQQFIPDSNNLIEVNLSKEKSGIYILKIEGRDNTINTYKIIKN